MKTKTNRLRQGIALLIICLAASCASSSKEEGDSTESKAMAMESVETEVSENMDTSALIEVEEDAEHNTESYAAITENDFKNAGDEPLSTFSIDVDNASYTNVRRFLTQDNSMPPADAVRIEEFINYFDYSYPIPSKEETFSINNELTTCPWNKENYLLRVGIKGYTIPTEKLPSSNITFLIDVSGSMDQDNKLPLLKKSLELLLHKLDSKDRVAIVVYAGNSGMILPSTSAADKETILASLKKLEAGGSTAGYEGLKGAYEIAAENFIPNGNNRIFLATDGDFNIGPSSDGEMAKMVETYRDKGIFITVLGFGMGNYKDSKMEIISDKGNGNYFYIDDISEAQKVLVDNMAATMYTIAKDVKIQVEFNPAYVKSYRLIGYENRMLNNQDFEDDTKDAGELGAGHTITAIYEIVPGKGNETGKKLKYQNKQLNAAANNNELVTVKFRYKKPDENTSREIVRTVMNNPKDFSEASTDLKFTAAVSSFGMLLRGSKYAGDFTYDKILETALANLGDDVNGYRAEFIRLVKQAKTLSSLSKND
jgi:Ca-activated chloride channel homolog